MCSLFFEQKLSLHEKDYMVCNLPNKSELHIVQLQVVQKYMDIASVHALPVTAQVYFFLSRRFFFHVYTKNPVPCFFLQNNNE